MPVLVVAGGYDRAYSDIARRMGEAIGTNAEVRIVDRAGHALHLERPEALAHQLAEWAPTTGTVE